MTAAVAGTLFDRIEQIEIDKEPLLSAADQALIAQAHAESAETLSQIRAVEAAIGVLEEGGNNVAGELLKDAGDALEKYRRRAVTKCYAKICTTLNRRYGTRFESRTVFGEDCPSGSRYDDVPSLLSEEEIAEKVGDAVGALDLEEAGARAVVDFFREYVSSRKGAKIGKTYIRLPHFFYFDTYFEQQLSYSSREAVQALAKALWFFEHERATPPGGFLQHLRAPNTEIETGTKLLLPTSFERTETITIYQNGTLKINFTSPEHMRAFVNTFELG